MTGERQEVDLKALLDDALVDLFQARCAETAGKLAVGVQAGSELHAFRQAPKDELIRRLRERAAEIARLHESALANLTDGDGDD